MKFFNFLSLIFPYCVSFFVIPFPDSLFKCYDDFWESFSCCPHENAIVTENATSQRRCPVADQKDRSLRDEIAQKGLLGTPGDEVIFDTESMRIHWYLQYSDSFSPPEPLCSIFYHFIKYLVPQKMLEKQRKDIYFET